MLPPELQLKIWKEASTSSSTIFVCKPPMEFSEHGWSYYPQCHASREGRKDGGIYTEFTMRGTLCLVNRYLYHQISGEAAYDDNKMFFASNAFAFDHPPKVMVYPAPTEFVHPHPPFRVRDTLAYYADVRGWMKSIGEDRRLQVKDLTVAHTAQFSRIYGDDENLLFLKRFPGLRHLTISEDMAITEEPIVGSTQIWYNFAHLASRWTEITTALGERGFERSVAGFFALASRGLLSFQWIPEETWQPENNDESWLEFCRGCNVRSAGKADRRMSKLEVAAYLRDLFQKRTAEIWAIVKKQ